MVVVASEARPLPAVTLGEVLATSDVPGGVVNMLTGPRPTPRRAGLAHGRQRASTSPASPTPELADQLEVAAAENLKRVRRPPPRTGSPTRAWTG